MHEFLFSFTVDIFKSFESGKQKSKKKLNVQLYISFSLFFPIGPADSCKCCWHCRLHFASFHTCCYFFLHLSCHLCHLSVCLFFFVTLPVCFSVTQSQCIRYQQTVTELTLSSINFNKIYALAKENKKYAYTQRQSARIASSNKQTNGVYVAQTIAMRRRGGGINKLRKLQGNKNEIKLSTPHNHPYFLSFYLALCIFAVVHDLFFIFLLFKSNEMYPFHIYIHGI